MIKLLFPIVCGLAWAFRGGAWIKCIHGYARSLLTAFVIIGTYCLCTPTMSVFSYKGLFAVLSLTLLEGLLGFGSTCEKIDDAYTYMNGDNVEVNYLFIEDEAKEPLNYLGFIGMSYYLFPYMILQPGKPTWVYILIAVLGFRIYPLTKLAQIKIFNDIVNTQVITIPIIKKDIKIAQSLCWLFSDPWKICEFLIGMGFGLWLSGIIL